MRPVVSALLLGLALAAAGALAASALWRSDGADGLFGVEVVGPDGRLLDETVRVEDATALRALAAAAQERGVALALEEHPGMGTYVRAIGPYEAKGASGWIYEVGRGGEWIFGDRSAAFFALDEGDRVRWSWSAR